jgi:hypothetical protein
MAIGCQLLRDITGLHLNFNCEICPHFCTNQRITGLDEAAAKKATKTTRLLIFF